MVSLSLRSQNAEVRVEVLVLRGYAKDHYKHLKLKDRLRICHVEVTLESRDFCHVLYWLCRLALVCLGCSLYPSTDPHRRLPWRLEVL